MDFKSGKKGERVKKKQKKIEISQFSFSLIADESNGSYRIYVCIQLYAYVYGICFVDVELYPGINMSVKVA